MIDKLKPAAIVLQETKLYKKGTLKFDEYDSFESVRGTGEGGGLVSLIHKKLNPVEIPIESDSKSSENIIVVEADIGKERVRTINGYGPQEYAQFDQKIGFFSLLDEQIQSAIDDGKYCCVQMDGNGKFGGSIIPGDSHKQTNNGKLLLDIITRKNLRLVNGTSKCKGKITRTRKVEDKVEESTIDFFFVCQGLYKWIDSMLIDEERKYSFKKYTRTKQQIVRVTESDHNVLILFLKYKFNNKIKPSREEIFN